VRVAHYPDTEEKFWVNHSKYRIAPMIYLLRDVKKFVEESSEIVFLDFHNFPIGFCDPSIHYELMEFVLRELEEHLVPHTVGTDVTPNDLWRLNRSIILTYADKGYLEKAIPKHRNVLWPYLIHVNTHTSVVHYA